MGHDYLGALAGLVCRVQFADLREETIQAARAVTLDTIGAILAGSRLSENARLAAFVAGRSGLRTVTLIGHAAKAEPMLAALANGTAGVALEMDEGNRWGGGHPAVHVLPAALAFAEEIAADGRRFVEDAENPVPREELHAKLTALASDALGARGARRVIEAAERVDRLDDVRELTALLTPA